MGKRRKGALKRVDVGKIPINPCIRDLEKRKKREAL